MARYLSRIVHDGRPRFVVEDEGRAWVVEGDGAAPAPAQVASAMRREATPVWWTGDDLLAPVAPGKVVGIGRNYRDHAAERGAAVPAEPMVFLKPPSSVVGPGVAIVLPPGVGRVDHEGELGVVIGTRASGVRREDAAAHVLGLTCVNDVTARDLQNRGVQFSHAKGYDSFCPLGPRVRLDVPPPGALAVDVSCAVNGSVRQLGNTRDLIVPVDVLIAYVSAIMTLEPGDVIATGTPAGISPLAPGDVVSVRVADVGELTNPVVAR